MVRVVLATPHTYQEQTIYMNPTILHDRGAINSLVIFFVYTLHSFTEF